MVNVYRNVYRTNFANSQDGYISGVIDICYKPFAAPEPFLEYLNLLNPKGYGLRPSGSFTHCNQHCN